MIISKLYDRQPLYHLEKLYHERFDLLVLAISLRAGLSRVQDHYNV